VKSFHRLLLPNLRCTLVSVVALCVLGQVSAQNWVLTGAPVTNWVSVASSADGKTVVAAASGFAYGNGPLGYIYISTNSGTNWSTANAPSNYWTAVAVSADGIRMVAVAGSEWNPQPVRSIYTSSNSGDTWQQSTAPSNIWRSVACSADGNRVVAVALNGDIYTSVDAGQLWVSNNVPVHWADVACSANGTKLVAVSSGVGSNNGSGAVYLSEDFGQSWLQSQGANITWPEWISVAASADRNKIVTGGSVAFTGKCCPCANICTSTDGGGHFFATSACLWYWVSLASSADGTRLAACQANGGPVFLSSDSGATWLPSGSFPGAGAVACSADGRKLIVAVNNGGIYTLDQLLGAPVLRIQRSNATGELDISWSVPSVPFILQQSPSLVTTSWQDVTGPPSLDNATLCYGVTVPAPVGAMFYRLAPQ
jgi:hypothetical protein